MSFTEIQSGLTYVIPGGEYRSPQSVDVPYLTDAEREALSYAYFDKQFEVRVYEDLAGKGDIISGWRDITPSHDLWRYGRLTAAMLSLKRLGLVQDWYDHSPRKERMESTDSDGYMHVRAAGWRYKLTEPGQQLVVHQARIYKCCDGCVRLTCVCAEKTFCAEHGGACHGTHD